MINFLIGLVAGGFGGLFGLGGGVIMIPLMTAVLKMGQHKAHGTSLVALIFTGIAGAATYALNGTIDIIASLLLASTAMFTARAGACYANVLPEWKLKRFFGIFLIFVTLLLPIKPYLSSIAVAGPSILWVKILTLLLIGVFTGFISGMMGVGGGTIMVPSMVLLAGISQHTAQGSSLLAMIPAGGVGAYTHWRLGNVNKTILPGLITGILIGTFLGGSFANYLTEGVLRILFAAMLIWTGQKYLRTPAPKAEQPEE